MSYRLYLCSFVICCSVLSQLKLKSNFEMFWVVKSYLHTEVVYTLAVLKILKRFIKVLRPIHFEDPNMSSFVLTSFICSLFSHFLFFILLGYYLTTAFMSLKKDGKVLTNDPEMKDPQYLRSACNCIQVSSKIKRNGQVKK